VLGYPKAAVADIEQALRYAREIGQAATLMYALGVTCLTDLYCGNYGAGDGFFDELLSLADEKGSLFWKAHGMLMQGWLFTLTGKAKDAIQIITSGSTAYRSTGATLLAPLLLSSLARAHAELGQFEDAWRRMGDAITALEATNERW
jgi:predicted ATPase